MSKKAKGRSAKDAALLSELFELLKSHAHADPYGWDGAFAAEIRRLPVGLRAMAATHHLDVSLTMDDIGWHFLNFGHPSHVEETELGLRELGVPDIPELFLEAYGLVSPLLPEILRPDGDYYDIVQREGHWERLVELSSQAYTILGEPGIYRYWIAYARREPDRVFSRDSHCQ